MEAEFLFKNCCKLKASFFSSIFLDPNIFCILSFLLETKMLTGDIYNQVFCKTFRFRIHTTTCAFLSRGKNKI